MNVVILGPPGAGKGTQAVRLALAFGVPRVSTGDILRSTIAQGTEFGRRVARQIDAGNLVADDTMIAIVNERLAEGDAGRGVILDGFPRTIPQAVALDHLMRDRGPVSVINLEVPEAELLSRLGQRVVCAGCGATDRQGTSRRCAQCGGAKVRRTDDAVDVRRDRLDTYARLTRPLLRHYQGRPTYRSIRGDRPADEVTAELQAAIETVCGAPERISTDGRVEEPL